MIHMSLGAYSPRMPPVISAGTALVKRDRPLRSHSRYIRYGSSPSSWRSFPSGVGFYATYVSSVRVSETHSAVGPAPMGRGRGRGRVTSVGSYVLLTEDDS